MVIANLAIEEIAQVVDFRHGQSFGEAQGQKAFDALYRNLAGESNTGEEIKVSTTLILTQSTAAVHQER
jgi:hypothetical protein